MAGQLYQHQGRQWAYGVCAAAMALLVGAALWLARHDMMPRERHAAVAAGDPAVVVNSAVVDALIP